MKPGFSLWISNDNGDRIFGPGPYNLLLLVDRLGSLNKAAKEMEMSYTKARNILNRAEKGLNVKLLNREVGGVNGGGSTLTKEARDIMFKYKEYKENVSLIIDKVFKDIFSEQIK